MIHNAVDLFVMMLGIIFTTGNTEVACQCYQDRDIALYQEETPEWLFQDHSGQCLADYTVFSENNIDEYAAKGIKCSKKGSTATNGTWTAYNGVIIDCENGDSFQGQVKCVRESGSITLFTDFKGLNEVGFWPNGNYTCCIEGSCINARVYQQDDASDKFIHDSGLVPVIESCTVVPPSDISHVPQQYIVQMNTSGIPPTLMSSSINCTNHSNNILCGKSYYTLMDLEHERFQYSIPVTWSGDSMDYTEHYYQCEAHYGDNEHNRPLVTYSELAMIKAPDAIPTGITYTVLNSTTVTIEWRMLSTSYINGFVINITSNDVTTTKVVHDPSVRSFTLNEIVVNQPYSISIRGFNELIGGAGTLNITVKVPQLLSVSVHESTTATSFTLVWDIEGDHHSNSLIRYFILTYTSLCDYTSNTLNITNNSIRNITVGDRLSAGQMYSVTLTLWSTVGSGNTMSVTVKLLDNGPPEVAPVLKPIKVINSTSVRLSWDKLDCGSRNGIITGYSIHRSGGRTPAVLNTHEETTTAVVITGLMEYTVYKFHIAAVSRVGSGPFSDEQIVYITINGTIMGLSSQESTRFIELSWQPIPGLPNDITIQYEVVYFTNNTLFSGNEVIDNKGYISYSNTTDTSVIVTGLEPDTWYTFGVKMLITSMSNDYTVLSLKTKSESLNPLSAIVLNTSTVLFSWSPLPDIVIDKFVYEVGFSRCPASEQFRQCTWSITDESIHNFNTVYTPITNTTDTLTTITNLTPDSCYLFGVRPRSLMETMAMGQWNIIRNLTLPSTTMPSIEVKKSLDYIITISVSVVAGILLILVICFMVYLIRQNRLLKKQLKAIHDLRANSYSALDTWDNEDYNQNGLNEMMNSRSRRSTIQMNTCDPYSLNKSLIDDGLPLTDDTGYANDTTIYDRITDRSRTGGSKIGGLPTYIEIRD